MVYNTDMKIETIEINGNVWKKFKGDEGQDVSLQLAHFKAGSGYLLNTSKTHCATNYSDKERIHLIASVRDITQVS